MRFLVAWYGYSRIELDTAISYERLDDAKVEKLWFNVDNLQLSKKRPKATEENLSDYVSKMSQETSHRKNFGVASEVSGRTTTG